MRFHSALILLVVILPVFAQQREMPPTWVGGTRVKLKPPTGFEPSQQFSGYGLESLGASIIVTEFPGPFDEVSSAFSKPTELEKKGITLISKQAIQISGQNGVLLQANQTALGSRYLKWILIFGDEKESVLITATFPNQYENELAEKMRASVLSASWDRARKVSPTEGLRFTITEAGDLKLARRISNTLAFTKSGVFPSKAIDDPLFIVGQAISKVEVDQPDEFAKSRILQTANVNEIEIEQTERVNIDELSGYEIVAKGNDKATGQPMLIYQTMLFDDHSYYLMQGLISDKQRHLYLSRFKTMARSFKRK